MRKPIQQTIQQTIRMNKDVSETIKQKAAQIGSSYNSFVNVLLDFGLRLYESSLHMSFEQDLTQAADQDKSI